MGVCDYVINIVAAFIAIEYMDHGFEKRYSCIKHRILFAMGCGVYFLWLRKLTTVLIMKEYYAFYMVE